MLCDLCGKRPATVHLTEIVNGKVTELHLCQECAFKKSQEMQKTFSLGDVLAGLIGEIEETTSGVGLRCPKCGLSYAEFRKVGRLGCAYCYVSFKKYLIQLIKTIHGAKNHTGKVPSSFYHLKIDAQIKELKRKLARAVELEEFEEAARLRDKIKELERKRNESQ